jgi:hypothetical protein
VSPGRFLSLTKEMSRPRGVSLTPWFHPRWQLSAASRRGTPCIDCSRPKQLPGKCSLRKNSGALSRRKFGRATNSATPNGLQPVSGEVSQSVGYVRDLYGRYWLGRLHSGTPRTRSRGRGRPLLRHGAATMAGVAANFGFASGQGRQIFRVDAFSHGDHEPRRVLLRFSI